jgi:hypothetical protein
MSLIDLYGYRKNDWFNLTEEEKQKVITLSIENAITDKTTWVKLIDKSIIPKLLQQEEYEMIDVFNKIRDEINKELKK